jgi:hypothetical protein
MMLTLILRILAVDDNAYTDNPEVVARRALKNQAWKILLAIQKKDVLFYAGVEADVEGPFVTSPEVAVE